MPITREDYLNKRNILIVQYVNEKKLKHLKILYEKDINSTRRLSFIDSLGSLIEVLEKRGCVSEKDITILENIAKEINFPEQTFSQPPVLFKPFVLEPKSLDVTQKVHQEIITKLGRHWIGFARALGVQDGDIDNIYKPIYAVHPRECIKNILEFHKNNALTRDWKFLLLKALSDCRRNELRETVEYIFEHF